MSDRPFRVLSLSGGGIRGIFQAVYLARLAEHFPGPIHKYFDLVCGTSTGAIVALAVALGIEPKEIVKAYREKGAAIFQTRIMGRVRKGGRYDPKPLTETLSSLFGDKKLSDVKTDLVVTATPIDDFGHKVFTTLDGLDGPDCESLLASEVVAASASAPTYFPPRNRRTARELSLMEVSGQTPLLQSAYLLRTELRASHFDQCASLRLEMESFLEAPHWKSSRHSERLASRLSMQYWN